MAQARGKEQGQAQQTGAAQAEHQAQVGQGAGTQGTEQAQEQRPARRAGGVPMPAEVGAGLRPWRPGGVFRRIFEDFDRLFEEMERSVFGRSLSEEVFRPFPGMREAPVAAWTPRIEVRDAGRELQVVAELPGVDPKDVRVECTEDGLVIQGETREERTGEEAGIYRSERRYGQFFRHIPLPQGLELDRAQASFKNGLLMIRLPRTEEAQARVRRIPIASEAGGTEGAAGGAQGGGR